MSCFKRHCLYKSAITLSFSITPRKTCYITATLHFWNHHIICLHSWNNACIVWLIHKQPLFTPRRFPPSPSGVFYYLLLLFLFCSYFLRLGKYGIIELRDTYALSRSDLIYCCWDFVNKSTGCRNVYFDYTVALCKGCVQYYKLTHYSRCWYISFTFQRLMLATRCWFLSPASGHFPLNRYTFTLSQSKS